ncbi:hypothetical protein [Mycobacterium sp. 852002-40037_SCH5390672]|uniref:hypothetical protein n=1 Tax=Mycobacterium sp. 852002-40037_SCH5390672 TaxID=1834089 RepID=UPI001E5BF4DC|nr:hypothetical protein [Mycobacterium sp. 852002-40037_SCH5390672]
MSDSDYPVTFVTSERLPGFIIHVVFFTLLDTPGTHFMAFANFARGDILRTIQHMEGDRGYTVIARDIDDHEAQLLLEAMLRTDRRVIAGLVDDLTLPGFEPEVVEWMDE